MRHKPLEYPFIPKSVRVLVPGQFWALPLSDGSFGCCRVIQTPPPGPGASRVLFLAALLDWHGPTKPSRESIAGAACIKQSQLHICAVLRTGGAILGHRPLDAEGIEPWLFRGSEYHANSVVLRGLTPLRTQRPTDRDLPVLCTSGYGVLTLLAERRFVARGGTPDAQKPAAAAAERRGTRLAEAVHSGPAARG